MECPLCYEQMEDEEALTLHYLTGCSSPAASQPLASAGVNSQAPAEEIGKQWRVNVLVRVRDMHGPHLLLLAFD